MLNTLKAVVHGERIEWQESVENLLPANERVEVLVTLLRRHPGGISSEEMGRRRVAALERLAARNAFASVDDPVEWQREAREDRDLPDRK